jgi:hypothetical protein
MGDVHIATRRGERRQLVEPQISLSVRGTPGRLTHQSRWRQGLLPGPSQAASYRCRADRLLNSPLLIREVDKALSIIPTQATVPCSEPKVAPSIQENTEDRIVDKAVSRRKVRE